MEACRRLTSFFSIVYVTVPSMDVARKIAKGAVEGRLAACVNIVPQVTSIYQWQGKLEEDNELLLIIKTKSEQLEALKQHVISNHPYDVPEFIAMPIEYGSEPYLKWIHDNVDGATQPPPSGASSGTTDAKSPSQDT